MARVRTRCADGQHRLVAARRIRREVDLLAAAAGQGAHGEVVTEPQRLPGIACRTAERAAERAAARLQTFRCGGRPHLLLIRSFDGASCERADGVRRRVRAHVADVDVTTRPGSVAPGGRPGGQLLPALEVSGGPSGPAMPGWSRRPNQPERGALAFTLDGPGEVVLQPGQSVTVRPGQHLREAVAAR